MKLLAIETSSAACSVALTHGDETAESHVIEPRAHTRILIPMITELLGQAGLRLGDLDAIVLGNGPGSFIGMRIGASVAQGMAYGAGLKIVPVSSLAAVAAQCMVEESAGAVAVAQDARMDEIYLGFYKRDGAGLPVLAGMEAIAPADSLPWPDGEGGRWTAAGEGWQRYPALLDAGSAFLEGVSTVRVPRARYLLGVGRVALERGHAIEPENLQPAYLRTQVATPPKA